MRTFEFRIDYPKSKLGKTAWNRQYGLNAYYSGKHWAARKKDAEYWHLLTREAVYRSCKHPRVFDKPVEIIAYFNDNLDCSNHASELKMIEDGLKGILIIDDNKNYVQGISMYFHAENYIKVVVKEVDLLLKP